MLIYFDESYDQQHKYLILGALFNPHPKFLHREFGELKRSKNFVDSTGEASEIKYNLCTNSHRLELCKGAIDIFFRSTSYFRCIVIREDLFDINFFGNKNENENIKMARAYKKFAELLIAHNTENVCDGVLLTDELTRCKGDRFMEIMKQDFCTIGGKHATKTGLKTLRDIIEIRSHHEQYQVNQINDILMGCVLNNLVPTTKTYKNDLRQYLVSKLQVPSLLPQDWGKYSKTYVEEHYPKFNIWYWEPGTTKLKNPPIQEIL